MAALVRTTLLLGGFVASHLQAVGNRATSGPPELWLLPTVLSVALASCLVVGERWRGARLVALGVAAAAVALAREVIPPFQWADQAASHLISAQAWLHGVELPAAGVKAAVAAAAQPTLAFLADAARAAGCEGLLVWGLATAREVAAALAPLMRLLRLQAEAEDAVLVVAAAARGAAFAAPFAVEQALAGPPQDARWAAALPLPCAWVIREYAEHQLGAVHGTWGSAAYSVASLHLIQLLSWGGVYLLAFLVVWGGATLAVEARRALAPPSPAPGPPGPRRAWRWRGPRAGAVVLAALGAAYAAGHWRLSSLSTSGAPTLLVATVTVAPPPRVAEVVGRVLFAPRPTSEEEEEEGAARPRPEEVASAVRAAAEATAAAEERLRAAREEVRVLADKARRLEAAGAASGGAGARGELQRTRDALGGASDRLSAAEEDLVRAHELEHDAASGEVPGGGGIPKGRWAWGWQEVSSWDGMEEAGPELRQHVGALKEATRRAAAAGARVVVWTEAAAVTIGGEREEALREDLRELARELGVYILAGVGAVYAHQSTGRAVMVNRALLIDEYGRPPVVDQAKAHPWPGSEYWNTQTETRAVGAAYTDVGVMAALVGVDADFPHQARRAGAQGTGLLLVPAAEYASLDPVHAHMARFRAVEGGFSLVRSAAGGVSMAVDLAGREIAAVGPSQPGGGTPPMMVAVPMAGVSTLYARVGDVVPWACGVLLGLLATARVLLFFVFGAPN